jgi:dimethylamine/trimethylamine dehydrogenase
MASVIAERIRQTGVPVTYVTNDDSVSAWAGMTSERWRIRTRLIELGIDIVTAHDLIQFDGFCATLSCCYSGKKQELSVSNAVLVTQRMQNDTLYREILGRVDGDVSKLPFTLRRIGDCEAPAIIAAAVYAGHRYAMELDAPIDIDEPLKHDRVDVGAEGLGSSSRPTPEYLDTLLRYYEEEVAGEAYFCDLAKRVKTTDQTEKMLLLGAVERHVAAIVAPLLGKYGLVPRPTPELIDEGRQDAQDGPQTYEELLTHMRETFPGYIDDFNKLESIAPKADRAILRRMTEHEIVAIEFFEREAAGAANSTEPLKQYLNSSLTA